MKWKADFTHHTRTAAKIINLNEFYIKRFFSYSGKSVISGFPQPFFLPLRMDIHMNEWRRLSWCFCSMYIRCLTICCLAVVQVVLRYKVQNTEYVRTIFLLAFLHYSLIYTSVHAVGFGSCSWWWLTHYRLFGAIVMVIKISSCLYNPVLDVLCRFNSSSQCRCAQDRNRIIEQIW